MPLYTIATRKPLPEQMRFDIAQTITDVHCGLTGAPPEFVNVIFMTGYRMRRGAFLGLNGNVRIGGNRGDDLYEQLNRKLLAQVAQVAKLDPAAVLVKLIGVEFNWVVEGAMTMPAPGEEGDWLERKKAIHAAMGITDAA
ncbi:MULTISPECIES: hypothetical protein [unclassified Ruegeria]|uniref:hypothetical protein n=1 Tax=unclassified Ruegeria TaxID=2625375 RepID=UPI001ADB2CC5|nr:MULTISPECIES: hypothetical protein [unclassified Ruegeria]MBO9413576.1 hypothetical protein [Ruegeria sp. R8_1]MBO9417241.1 hypothetical protein [Ruegeria sp. R8_2]